MSQSTATFEDVASILWDFYPKNEYIGHHHVHVETIQDQNYSWQKQPFTPKCWWLSLFSVLRFVIVSHLNKLLCGKVVYFVLAEGLNMPFLLKLVTKA